MGDIWNLLFEFFFKVRNFSKCIVTPRPWYYLLDNIDAVDVTVCFRDHDNPFDYLVGDFLIFKLQCSETYLLYSVFLIFLITNIHNMTDCIYHSDFIELWFLYVSCSLGDAAIQWQLFASPIPNALFRFPVIVAGLIKAKKIRFEHNVVFPPLFPILVYWCIGPTCNGVDACCIDLGIHFDA